MFKTMDNTPVYDKADVDQIKNAIDSVTSQHTADIQQLNQNKADKTYAQETRQIANNAKNDIGETDTTGLKGRVKAVEDSIGDNNVPGSIKGRVKSLEDHSVTTEQLNQRLINKADKSYAEQTRNIANEDHAEIVSIKAAMDNKVNKSELASEVNSIIGDAIAVKLQTIEPGISDMVDDNINDHSMTTTEATAIVNQYF